MWPYHFFLLSVVSQLGSERAHGEPLFEQLEDKQDRHSTQELPGQHSKPPQSFTHRLLNMHAYMLTLYLHIFTSAYRHKSKKSIKKENKKIEINLETHTQIAKSDTQIINHMYAYTHKEVYTTVLLGKWTKTTDPGERPHMFTHKLHPVESLSLVSTTESHSVR